MIAHHPDELVQLIVHDIALAQLIVGKIARSVDRFEMKIFGDILGVRAICL